MSNAEPVVLLLDYLNEREPMTGETRALCRRLLQRLGTIQQMEKSALACLSGTELDALLRELARRDLESDRLLQQMRTQRPQTGSSVIVQGDRNVVVIAGRDAVLTAPPGSPPVASKQGAKPAAAPGATGEPEVFISYSSRDRQRVVGICEHLSLTGVSIWRDQDEILGGENYGPKIVAAIQQSRLLVLMCTPHSLGSKNVKQEIQLAWECNCPYLPLRLEAVSYPAEVQYWLTGWQWIDVLDQPAEAWLPAVRDALLRHGVRMEKPPR